MSNHLRACDAVRPAWQRLRGLKWSALRATAVQQALEKGAVTDKDLVDALNAAKRRRVYLNSSVTGESVV